MMCGSDLWLAGSASATMDWKPLPFVCFFFLSLLRPLHTKPSAILLYFVVVQRENQSFSCNHSVRNIERRIYELFFRCCVVFVCCIKTDLCLRRIMNWAVLRRSHWMIHHFKTKRNKNGQLIIVFFLFSCCFECKTKREREKQIQQQQQQLTDRRKDEDEPKHIDRLSARILHSHIHT